MLRDHIFNEQRQQFIASQPHPNIVKEQDPVRFDAQDPI
jgi:hypothetical protein